MLLSLDTVKGQLERQFDLLSLNGAFLVCRRWRPIKLSTGTGDDSSEDCCIQA